MRAANAFLLCVVSVVLSACYGGMILRYDVSGPRLAAVGTTDSLVAQFTKLSRDHGMTVIADQKTRDMRMVIVRNRQENTEIVLTLQDSASLDVVVKFGDPNSTFVATLRPQLEALFVSYGLTYRASHWRSAGFE